MADASDFAAKLKALSDAYAARLPERLDQIEQAWERLPMDRWDEEAFTALYRMVHSLTGSGKSYGFTALSDVARASEGVLKRLAETKEAPDERQRSHVRGFLAELRQAAAARDGPPEGQG